MSYSVKLTSEALRKMRGWNLSSDQMREILKGFDSLATHPARQLIRVGPPYDALYYDWVVAGGGVRDGGVLYTFRIRYGVDEETLWIDDCDRVFDEPTA